MRRITQKLHSRRGASVLLALLLTLVAVMISAVIVSASLSAAKRVNDDRDQEQNALNISSAARVIGACIKDSKCTITYTETKDDRSGTIVSTGSPVFTGTGPLGGQLSTGAETAYTETDETLKSMDNIALIVSDASIPAATLQNVTIQHYVAGKEYYLVSGTVKIPGNDWTLYLSAYVQNPPSSWSFAGSTTSDPFPTGETVTDPGTGQQKPVMTTHTTTTYKKVLEWDMVEITTVRES